MLHPYIFVLFLSFVIFVCFFVVFCFFEIFRILDFSLHECLHFFIFIKQKSFLKLFFSMALFFFFGGGGGGCYVFLAI